MSCSGSDSPRGRPARPAPEPPQSQIRCAEPVIWRRTVVSRSTTLGVGATTAVARVESLLANVSGGLLIWLRGWDGALTAPAGLGWGASGVTGQLPRHDHDCGPEHHGLMMFGEPFVVADQAAVTHQPSEGSLDDPAAGHHDESAGVENDNPIWPHCDGLIWPHLGSCGDGC